LTTTKQSILRPVAKSLRILHCTWGYGHDLQGGAERQAQLQAEELVRLGHSVEVVCPRWPGTATGDLNGVSVTRLPFVNRRPLKTLTYSASLATFMSRNVRRFDLVHVHLAIAHADVVCLIAHFARVPVWVKLAASGPHGEIGRTRRVAWLTRWVGLRWATKVQALSTEIEAELIGIGVDAERIVSMPNGVDTSRFTPADEAEKLEVRRRLGIREDAVFGLFVGRLAKHKGVPELIRAWRRLDGDRLCLILVGSLATMDPIDPISPDVSVIARPWTDRIEDYYRASDAFILPSHVEGMSNALLEAMACGLPVVASAVGATATVVQDGVNGLLVEPGDEAALQRALTKLVADHSLRRRLGSAARETALNYSIPKVSRLLEAGYYEMVGLKC
jgi:glycosyltransferase involved in cell wall biosynthesis